MKNTLQVTENAVISMTSLEIAELTGKRHDSVKRTIEILSQETDKRPAVIQLPHSVEVKNHLGQSVTQYVFSGEQGKLDSITITAQLCPEFTAAIVKRWQELETQIRLPAETQIRLPAETSAELQAEVSAVTKTLLYVSKQVEDLTRIHTPSLQVKTLSNWNNQHRNTLAKLQCDVANLKSRLAQTKMSPNVTQQIKDNLEWVLLQQGSAYELVLVELIMRNDQYEQATRKYNDLKAGILRISYSCSPSQTCADLTKLYNENP